MVFHIDTLRALVVFNACYTRMKRMYTHWVSGDKYTVSFITTLVSMVYSHCEGHRMHKY